jgi:CBS domain-containing protein
MESLQDGIRAASALAQKRPTPRPLPVTARDIMSDRLLVLRPEQTMAEAIVALDRRGVSGAPVITQQGELVGVLSEFDCMKMVASRAFHHETLALKLTVADLMSPNVLTLAPNTDLPSICHRFMTTKVRRLPVVEDDRVIGMVSRRDVLKALRDLYA